MSFDLQRAQRNLNLLKLGNSIAWLLTAALFVFPWYQWIHLGRVPLDTTFFALTALNIIVLAASVKLASMVKFTSYQIRYFSCEGEQRNG
jgi:hypothetical protein